jgi:hypothetical protein
MAKYPKLPPIVEIFWEDHYSIDDDWYDKDDVHDICILSAIGYLVHEDEHYYYVSCTYELDSQRYSAGTAVLKNCVLNFRRYTEADAIVDEVRKTFKTKGKPLNVKPSGSGKTNKKNTSKHK